MKLNAAVEMLPLSWPEFTGIHPFVPKEQAAGTLEIIRRLEGLLGEITGLPGVSLQPNAGSQGEYSGLLLIRAYHRSRGEAKRNVCLIPVSAHGTNPASAALAGMEIQAVRCDDFGNVDLEHLQELAQKHADHLSAMMLTYPSTHGVFEHGVTQNAEIVHGCGGLLYMDGANLNAQVGLCRPGDFGVDVCHLNLHKSFAIPHGGGGPGVGPVCCNARLKPFLPKHIYAECGGEQGVCAVSSAPWGSASVLLISYAYLSLMGRRVLERPPRPQFLMLITLLHVLSRIFGCCIEVNMVMWRTNAFLILEI
jgi:glycine dehydrogenase